MTAHQHLRVFGHRYAPDAIGELRHSPVRSVREDLYAFLHEWMDPNPAVEVQTSGSTGKPKHLRAEKTRMMASARMTCSFLGLKAGDSALLCMPLRYIGAKMMVVRALVQDLNLWCVEPSAHPLQGLDAAPYFAAMTPAQLYSSLQNEEEAALLRQVRHLLIGGSAVEAGLEKLLRSFPHHVWSTYGMTETLSHIALRRLNGADASMYYTPLEGVKVRLAADGALAISAPAVCGEEVITNDLAQLNAQGGFRILGRKDNVINSGGIKLQIEEIESLLQPLMPCAFQITAVPDSHYGEVVAMLVEEEGDWTPFFSTLHPYSRPKHVYRVGSLPRTGSGKADRAAARMIAARLNNSARNVHCHEKI